MRKHRIFYSWLAAITACLLSLTMFGCASVTPTVSESESAGVTSEPEPTMSESQEASSEVVSEAASSEEASSAAGSSSTAASQSKVSSAASSAAASSSASSSITWTLPTSVDMNLGALPTVSDPPVGDEGHLTADGKWYINNLVTMSGDRIIVNANGEHGIAFYVAQGLGDAWNISATLRMIKRYPEDQPTCGRLFVRDVYGNEVFIFTLSYVNNSVEIVLQVLDRVWKTLITTDGWKDTSSTVFSYGLRREAGSNKLSVYVLGDKGMLMDKTCPISLSDTILAKAAVAGFGTYSSAVEYSHMLVIGNGPKNVDYPQPQE